MHDNDIELRIKRLEEAIFGDGKRVKSIEKPLALSELAASKLITNGQHKIVVILGYNELIQHGESLGMPEIRKAWVSAKFDLKPDPKQLERAIKAGLVRDPENTKRYDLTRKGEAYFQTVMEDTSNG
jgi:hypothetical protein